VGLLPCLFFNNFGEFAQAVLLRIGSSPSTELALFTKPSSSSLSWAIPSLSSPHLRGECSSRPRPPPFEVSAGIAFHRVDPAPFLPHDFVAQQVDHREIMVHTVTHPQPSAHEDWGIVLVQPLPEHEINFHFFDDIIREYLMGVRHVQVRSIQRSHLGQALVRFRFAFDSDNLVALGRSKPWVFLSLLLCTMRLGTSVRCILTMIFGFFYSVSLWISGHMSISRMQSGLLVGCSCGTLTRLM
jgi:hypothetical protein